MKRNRRAVILALAIGLSAPAFAKADIDFALYEGPPKIAKGEGGAKITQNGIDYWTMGTPPRRYQIIGFVQDKRDENQDGGRAIGSPSIAKQVKAAGGNAVIIESQDWNIHDRSNGKMLTVTRMLCSPSAPMAQI